MRFGRRLENVGKRLMHDTIFYGPAGRAAPNRRERFADWLHSNAGRGEILLTHTLAELSYPQRVVDFAESEVRRLQQEGIVNSSILREEIAGTLSVDSNRQFLATLKNGRVFSKWGIVMTDDNVAIDEVGPVGFANQNSDISLFSYHGRLPSAQRIRGRVAVLARVCASNNYYHWLVDVLPTIRELSHSPKPIDYYFTYNDTKFHRQSLLQLGIRPEQIIPATRYAHIEADELLFPMSERSPCFAGQHDYLRDRYANENDAIAAPFGSGGRHVYISRARCRWRQVVNECELLEQLKPLGFSAHTLEELSFREQVSLFQQADVIVGPHGAGFANMIFSKPGTKMIELATAFRAHPCFYHLAMSCGHDYRALFCEPVNGRRSESNLSVDPNQVAGLVEAMLSSQRLAA